MIDKSRHFSLYIQLIFWLSLGLRLFFLSNHDLQVEEAYYWNYSMHLDFGYLDHPPLIAVLIKSSTFLLGLNEFAIRLPAIVCWGIATLYIYKWCELIQIGSGQYSVLLLSILPFFFIDSGFVAPDMPMSAAWSAGLYYLYRVFCLQEKPAWYAAGLSLGLGFLAKYSIGLVVLSTFIFLLVDKEQRHWFLRKEPYLAAGIMMMLFSPVIYWNYTHDWVSFSFQSTRRLQDKLDFSLQELLGLLILFLTPFGLIGLKKLFYSSENKTLTRTSRLFLQIYTLIPLLVYSIFSCFHGTKFNWIGPGLLAIVPWLAYLMQQYRTVCHQWLTTAPLFLGAYALLMCCISYGKPQLLNTLLFTKMVSWERLTEDLYRIAKKQSKITPSSQIVFMPLDLYGIASELNFYQTKQYKHNPNLQPFSVVQPGLMYQYWTNSNDLRGKTIILVSPVKIRFAKHQWQNSVEKLSPIKTVWGVSQGKEAKTVPYFYQIVRML